MSETTDTLMGGRPLEVELLNGKKKTIQVRQLSFAEVPNLLGCWNNDHEKAALYLGVDENDEGIKILAEVTPESGMKIVELGDELNEQAFLDLLASTKKKLTSPVAQALAGLAVNPENSPSSESPAGSSSSSAADLVSPS